MVTLKSKILYLILTIVLLLPLKPMQDIDLFSSIKSNNQGRNNKNIYFLIHSKTNLKQHSDNNSILHVAINYNHNKQHNNIIKTLVAYNANINAKNSSGNTPLYYAFANNHDGVNNKIIKFLIKQGATLNINSTQFSWKFFVQHYENIRLSSYYYESGIDFFITDNKGKTIKDYVNNESLEKILTLQRKKRTQEETKQIKILLTINTIMAIKNKSLKIPKPLLKLIFDYLKIPTYNTGVPLF